MINWCLKQQWLIMCCFLTTNNNASDKLMQLSTQRHDHRNIYVFRYIVKRHYKMWCCIYFCAYVKAILQKGPPNKATCVFKHLKIIIIVFSFVSGWLSVALFGKHLLIINFKRHGCSIKFSTLHTVIDCSRIRFPCFLCVFPEMETLVGWAERTSYWLATCQTKEDREKRLCGWKKLTKIHFNGHVTWIKRPGEMFRGKNCFDFGLFDI